MSEETTVAVDCGVFMLKLKGEGPPSILDVKKGVEVAIGVPVARQNLAYPDLNVEPNPVLLTVGGDIILSLTVTSLPPHTKLSVTVAHYYESFPYEEDFEVEETDTVIQLKQKIRASKEFDKLLKKVATPAMQAQFLPKHLKLMRTDDLEMKNNDFPLSKYFVQDGIIIDMLITKPESEEGSTSTTPILVAD